MDYYRKITPQNSKLKENLWLPFRKYQIGCFDGVGRSDCLVGGTKTSVDYSQRSRPSEGKGVVTGFGANGANRPEGSGEHPSQRING